MGSRSLVAPIYPYQLALTMVRNMVALSRSLNPRTGPGCFIAGVKGCVNKKKAPRVRGGSYPVAFLRAFSFEFPLSPSVICEQRGSEQYSKRPSTPTDLLLGLSPGYRISGGCGGVKHKRKAPRVRIPLSRGHSKDF